MISKISFIIFIILFAGCAPKDTECKPVTVTKKCEATMPVKPKMESESGSDAEWLKAVLGNSGAKDSYIYDLEATVRKCI